MSDFKAKMHWGFASDPTGELSSAPPDPLALFKGPTSRGGGRRKGRRERKGRGRKGREELAPNWGVWIRQCCKSNTNVYYFQWLK